MRVLIAEDDRISRKFLEHSLSASGYDVTAVADGDEAWAALTGRDAPRLAVLDWMMPGLQGPEICERLRQRTDALPIYVILLTSRSTKEDIVAGLRAGADDYLTKPFDAEELRARVHVGVRLIELQQRLADQVDELARALAHVKQLHGLLPMCAWCKKIRNDSNYWQQVEVYISEHSDAQFSHGICPDCYQRQRLDPGVVLTLAKCARPLLVAALLAGCHGGRAGDGGVLTDLATVAKLFGDDAAQGRSVRVQGVVLYDDPDAHRLLLADAGGAVFVDTPGTTQAPKPGELLAVDGRTARDDRMNVVTASALRSLGPGPIPPPRRVSPRELLADRAPYGWVETAGVVRGLSSDRHSMVSLLVAAEGATVSARVLDYTRYDFGALVDARVRIRGVSIPVLDAEGKVVRVKVLVPGLDSLSVEQAAPADPYAGLPRPIQGLTEAGGDAAAGHRIHVRGVLRAESHDGVLTVEDATGRLQAYTDPLTPLVIGETIDVAGFLPLEPGDIRLENAVVHPATPAIPASAGEAAPASALATVASVHRLSPQEAAEKHPVRLRGVVTYADHVLNDAFVQDATGGIYVTTQNLKDSVLEAGQIVDVEGQTGPCGFAPCIDQPRFRILGRTALPDAPRPRLEDLFAGQQDSNWVEMQGTVRSVRSDEGGRVTLTLASGPLTYRAVVQGYPVGQEPSALIDADVTLRGACGAVFNEKRQMIGVVIYVPDPSEVHLRNEAPGDPFALPPRAVRSLMRFAPGESNEHRVHVRGIVTLQRPGESVFIRDETGGLLAQTRETAELTPGDVVDVVGFAALGEYGPVLGDATFRRIGVAKAPPPPESIAFEDAISGSLHAQLVRIQAYMVETGSDAGQYSLRLQAGGHTFTAALPRTTGESALARLRPGSLVDVTGICLVQTSTGQIERRVSRPHVESFRLLLRDAHDVRVLAGPPWWTPARALRVVAVMSLILFTGLAWVLLLRRKVRQQTAVIEEQLLTEARLRGEAQAASRAKTDFLASMSHEVRTPLNGVIGMASLLLRTELSGEQREYVETVDRSAQGLLTLINDILDVSKIEAGGLTIDAAPFDLAQVVSEVVGLLGGIAREKNLALSVHMAPAAPRFFRGDAVRVRQILTNLVGNAIKFTEAGRVAIDVTGEAIDEKTAAFRMAVEDTGIGVPEDKRDYIFERFTQVDPSLTRRHGGTGLGLAICRQLVQLMGGTIGVSSHDGPGSTFWFRLVLPVATEAEAAAAAAATAATTGTTVEARAAQDLARARGARVLVVEDNPVNQRVAVRLLERMGCRVDLAENGPDALRRLADPGYTAVFMDCEMPEMDGFEVTRRVRERERETGGHAFIIAMTAHAMAGDRERCLAAGMDEYLSKPVREATLWQAIGGALAARAPAPAAAGTGNGTDAVDGAALVALARGDVSFLADIARCFEEDAPARLVEIRRAVDAGDATALARVAHGLGGSLRTLMAPRGGELTAALEQLAERGSIDGALPLCDELQAEVARIHDALTALLVSPPARHP